MVTNVITKCNGKDKVVDFRDKLSRSLPDEYARCTSLAARKMEERPFPLSSKWSSVISRRERAIKVSPVP